MSLNGKVALVTGASRGIGHAIAMTLGKQGATVIGTATTEEGANKITEYLKKENISGQGYALNVCDADQISKVLAELTEKYSAPTILVNNAAVTRDNIMLRMKPEQWDEVINTNLNSIYRVTKACLKPMVKARWGRIISITSIVGVTGNLGQANYSTAKAGLIGFSKSLAQEVAGYGITVNAIAPGFIDTDMTRNLPEKARDHILGQIPMKRMGEPEDIAASVAFLASENAAYVTGQTLHVNGGMYMA